MYVKLHNGQIAAYPYSVGQLRRDNPQVSFPKTPNHSLLSEWGVFPVEPVSAPSVDYTKDVREGAPVYDNGWKQSWVVLPAEDIEKRLLELSENARAERNSLLAQTDWTQIADSTVDKSAWATYRQALRDVPQQPGFPYSVVWPNEPTGT